MLEDEKQRWIIKITPAAGYVNVMTTPHIRDAATLYASLTLSTSDAKDAFERFESWNRVAMRI